MKSNKALSVSEITRIIVQIFPNSTILDHWNLDGGVSHDVTAVKIETADRKLKELVVKSYIGFDWKNQGDSVAGKEFNTLKFLSQNSFSVPSVHLFDNSKKILPNAYMVMDLVSGNSQLNESVLLKSVEKMADFLAQLHGLNLSTITPLAIPELESPIEGALEYLPKVSGIKNVDSTIEKLTQIDFEPENSVLIHGDFWPNNILWRNNEIAAVIDWEDASTGDPMADFAGARMELFCMYGKACMDTFSKRYISVSGRSTLTLAIWEIYVAAAAAATMDSWGLNENEKAKRMKSTITFLVDAMARFSETG